MSAPILMRKIRFLNFNKQKKYLRVKQFIRKGDVNAPTAPPNVNTPIKNPLIVVFCDS